MQLLQKVIQQQLFVIRQAGQIDLPVLTGRVSRSRDTVVGIRGNQSKTAPLRVEIRSPVVGLRVDDADSSANVAATNG